MYWLHVALLFIQNARSSKCLAGSQHTLCPMSVPISQSCSPTPSEQCVISNWSTRRNANVVPATTILITFLFHQAPIPNHSLRCFFNSLLLTMSWHACGTATCPRGSKQQLTKEELVFSRWTKRYIKRDDTASCRTEMCPYSREGNSP